MGRVISPASYILVWGTLMLLTVLTVGISFLEVGRTWHFVAGLSIGMCKAALVALFFMHLLSSPRTTWAVVLVTVFWFAVVLLALTFSDFATRTNFPFVPGH